MKAIKILALAAAALCCAAAVAQNATITPYSRFAYGMLNDNAAAAQSGMGGVGYALQSGRQANVMNPASYAAIDSLTFLFDMGAQMSLSWMEEGGASEHASAGGLSYITMAFPLSHTVGASVGLLPFSSTGYDFGQAITNGASRHVGTGDVSQLYAGLGWQPVHNLYVGANASYLFGTILNDAYATTITGGSAVFERYMRVSDYKFDFGLQYSIDLPNADRITLGLAYSPGHNTHGRTWGIYYDAATTSVPDTVGNTSLSGGAYTMPASYGAGLSYQYGRKLLVEADFTYQPWKDAKFGTMENFEATTFDNRYKAAMGLQYTPYYRGSYLQRVQYRLGASYTRDYITMGGNNVRQYTASLGLGLPIPQFKSVLNLAFEYRRRQGTPQAMVKEDYFNITIGINFNEIWFRKAKIF